MRKLLKLNTRFCLIFMFAFFTFSSFSCKKSLGDNLEQTVSLSKASATLLVGQEIVLSPKFDDGNTAQRNYTWFNDNSQAVGITINSDNSATITAKSKGIAKITMSSLDGVLKATCDVIVDVVPTPDDGVMRILAIGNSFSEDPLETYLYDLAKADGKPIVIGNLYIGGATLDLHWQNASGNVGAYAYRKIDKAGNKTSKANTSIATAIADEKWNYISFQQASPNSGQYNTYVIPLPLLFNYVKQRATHTQVQYILHQTWAYAQNSTHTDFVKYDKDQAKMYAAIIDANEKVKSLVPINLVVPDGTAIQNGRNSYIGDNFCRDGYHLDLNIGRYTASCTWFETIFGKSVVGNSFKPAALSSYEAELAQYAAHYAVLKPNEVTAMVNYQNAGGLGITNPVFISFGAPSEIGWNNLTGFLAGSSIPNLKDKNGTFTGVALTVTERFNSWNATGEKITTTDFNMPQTISTRSYFGNPKAAFGNLTIAKSAIKLTGLNKDKMYNICFFGSRASVGTENRDAKYTLNGKNEAIVYLNGANNISKTACGNAVQPTTDGEITITITAGENNTNSYGFYHINAVRIELAN